jgi:hypothetical protein
MIQARLVNLVNIALKFIGQPVKSQREERKNGGRESYAK